MTINGRLVLRIHAGFLMILTPLLTAAAYVGFFLKLGPYAGFADDPLVIVGLAQAYLLMGLVAIAVWQGSRGPAHWTYSLLAIAAHCIPLSALALFWGPIAGSAIGATIPLSLLIHGTGIAVETLSLRFGCSSEGGS